MTTYRFERDNYPLMSAFRYFRKVWSPRVSYHLARLRYGQDWRERLVSFFWLVQNRVPRSGAVPSLDFRGMS
jgi:hypothetical protein